jgi:hypothetical protein
MKALRRIYPSVVGLLLGSLQIGLFFQLSFTLSSSFRTFLMVTVCWLLGSVAGIRAARHMAFQLNSLILLALLAYFACAALVAASPFNTTLWPVYAVLIMLTGFYPGAFFVRFGEHYTARELFFKENNGFIAGLISGTLFFLTLGRIALWAIPLLVASLLLLCTNRLLSYRHPFASG